MGMTVTTQDNLAERFWAKVLRASDPIQCWNWTGATSHGYGVIRINGKLALAHRVAYELVKGSIPANMELDHICRNTLCVNPDHLEAVSHGENIHRGIRKKRTVCFRGHPLTPNNTYTDKDNKRHCKICRLEAQRRRNGYYNRN